VTKIKAKDEEKILNIEKLAKDENINMSLQVRLGYKSRITLPKKV
jgi:hypothetical protein